LEASDIAIPPQLQTNDAWNLDTADSVAEEYAIHSTELVGIEESEWAGE
jgi:hypothetical protein